MDGACGRARGGPGSGRIVHPRGPDLAPRTQRVFKPRRTSAPSPSRDGDFTCGVALPPTRLPFEHHVFRVVAAVIAVYPEDDGDLHVILSEGGNTMISEAPEPSSPRRR